MASRTDPKGQQYTDTHATGPTTLRTSETLGERKAELPKQQPLRPEVDFNQLQARFG